MKPRTPEHSRKISESLKRNGRLAGPNNPRWKGNAVGYTALHHWIRKCLGSAQVCTFCSARNDVPKSIQWANKDGRYLRDLDNWISLCRKCHGKYDKDLRSKRNGYATS